MRKITVLCQKIPITPLPIPNFRGFAFAAFFFALALLFSGCKDESDQDEDAIQVSVPVLSIEGDAFSTQPGGSLTFVVKLDGGVVIPGAEEISLSREGGVLQPGTAISINPDTGKLTLEVAPDEAIGYKALTVTAVSEGKTASASVTVHTPEDNFTVTIQNGIVTIADYDGQTGDIVIPATITVEGMPHAVTAIGDSAFSNNQLTSVTIPDSVTTIGNSAFAYNQLTNVTIPDSVTTIGDYAFQYNKLTSVTIPGSVTAIGDCTFYGNQLISVTIPGSVTTIGNAAFQYNKLTSFTIPDSVTAIGNGAFYGNQLTSVTIPGSVTAIGDDAFQHNKLTSVTIPDSVTAIGDCTFYGNQLTSVTIPGSVTTIGEFAFGSNQLTSVTIPGSVTAIREYAFYNNQLTNISIGEKLNISDSSAFDQNNGNFKIDYDAAGKAAGMYIYDTSTHVWMKQNVNP